MQMYVCFNTIQKYVCFNTNICLCLVGKKDLPSNIRNKFTELCISEIENRSEIVDFITQRVALTIGEDKCESLCNIFQSMRSLQKKYLLQTTSSSFNQMSGASSSVQHVSFRNLARTLMYILNNCQNYHLTRLIYDGLYIGFGCNLSQGARVLFEDIV